VALLRLAGVSKNFGALKVVDDLTLDVAEGEALGILGPNGAGKSTMFGLIAVLRRVRSSFSTVRSRICQHTRAAGWVLDGPIRFRGPSAT
jgi:ABC-type branched-subunit amino acid transport system ATPase component